MCIYIYMGVSDSLRSQSFPSEKHHGQNKNTNLARVWGLSKANLSLFSSFLACSDLNERGLGLLLGACRGGSVCCGCFICFRRAGCANFLPASAKPRVAVGPGGLRRAFVLWCAGAGSAAVLVGWGSGGSVFFERVRWDSGGAANFAFVRIPPRERL